MPKEEKQYRTKQIIVKKGHRLYSYFQQNTENAKNLYNTTNFYYRQIFTALTSEKPLQPLQKEVMTLINDSITPMNEVQMVAYQKKVEKENFKQENKRKEVKLNLFTVPNAENPYVSYSFLDALFKNNKQPDYRSLPTQSSQAIMKKLFSNWKSFFASLKDYRLNPDKYLGKPKIPGYIKSSQKEVEFTNQDCIIKENRYLKFPKTKERLNIGKLGSISSKHKSVRVIPRYGYFVVEIIFENGLVEPFNTETNRLMTIDLGIDNIATITTNTGMEPVLLKGKNIKSINQYYNKQRAHYYGILRQGKNAKEGQFTSKRLDNLDAIRHRKIKDIFHKISFFIRELAEFEQVDTIIIGQNIGWKQNINLGKKNNQSFVQIPYYMLINLITYKAEEYGIRVIVAEESYTSKASFLDDDFIPTHGEHHTCHFSGRRIKRGLYRSKNNQFINADVNGSANIMRKFALKNGVQLHIGDVQTKHPLSYIIS